MKKKLFLILIVLFITLCAVSLADVEINETHFPDDYFREFVRNFDTNGDGSFSSEELADVAALSIYHDPDDETVLHLTSVQGLEYFTAITFLQITGTDLTTLNVDSNTALTIGKFLL